MRLLLVRHAASQPDPALPASAGWLGPDGHRAATTLARALPAPDVLLTSALPKAAGTAAAIAAVHGVEALSEPRLGETGGAETWAGGHRQRAARYVAGEQIDGWEPQADAVSARVDAALRDVAAAATVVAVSHGRVLTLWLAAVGAVLEPAAFWAGLRYPDAWALELHPHGAAWRVTAPPARVVAAP